VKPGDILLQINGNAINDFLDYRFFSTEETPKLMFQRPNGSRYAIKIRKAQYDELGLNFAEPLLDKERRCRNNCLFCFIDQLPQGLREPLYFKDDDARLSFLFGNYITLTNLSNADAERLIAMRISPVRVSVHTMDPMLRCRLMGNRFAGESLQYLQAFARAGLEIDAQLVLCPGINDGDALAYSLQELLKLPGNALRSVAAVPVGLTKYREKLPKLQVFTKQEAKAVLACFATYRQLAPPEVDLCAADEFFLLAEEPLPPIEYYGDLRQIENGVGLCAAFFLRETKAKENSTVCRSAPVLVMTGKAAYQLIYNAVQGITRDYPALQAEVLAVENVFFGENITVAGLLTGQDMIAQAKAYFDMHGKADLLLPSVCFRAERDLTLDGMTQDEIARALGVDVRVAEPDFDGLMEGLMRSN
jgi:putative radical SAM enzyme (TIGR03279 family)